MKSITITTLLLTLLASVPVYAADHEVAQKGKDFSQKDIKVKVGDTITFKNDDEVAHNLFSKSDSKIFEIPKQAPGEKETVTFDKAGEVKIRCAIHPKMKLSVTVE